MTAIASLEVAVGVRLRVALIAAILSARSPARPAILPAWMSRGLAPTEICLALTVGVVLADSSIVTLALPSILREYDATVFGVSWVLTAFNIVLALLILPGVRIARRAPRVGWAAGLAIFVGASSPARRPGPRGADRGSGRPGSRRCPRGRLRDRDPGPAARQPRARRADVGSGGERSVSRSARPLGGVLTQLLDWQSIFYLQIPLLLLIPVATTSGPLPAEPGPTAARSPPRGRRSHCSRRA